VYMQQATDSILWKRLNWLPTFIYVVKLDKDKIEEKKKKEETTKGERTCACGINEIKIERNSSLCLIIIVIKTHTVSNEIWRLI